MDGGNYIKEGKDAAKSTCLIFSPRADEVGALARSLKMFEVSHAAFIPRPRPRPPGGRLRPL